MTAYIPPPIARAFEDRVTIPMQTAARLLSMDTKTLSEHIKAGNIGYVSLGLGGQRKRREFTMQDILGFIERLRQRECPYTSPKTRRTTSMISSTEAVAFTALLEKRNAEKQRQLNARPVRK